ncbi:hypothetical protein B0T11DRAFT_339587 [Plectosphaerella cucumerina]|uniref:Endosomal spry domain-containing protein n=1 Tax=Plectosphaerella cucumerina TaxID=40658 RepID=A0A8K0TMF7_9PEZI|nr:hypothetical protein B0T11DRAFT_339587 [Plectosphaerella cucumerina]
MAPAAISQAAQHARSFVTERIPSTEVVRHLAASVAHSVAPVAARALLDSPNKDSSRPLRKRETEYKYDPHSGMTDTHDINNTAVFVIFGLIGAAFVCTGIWFFFWAKNGGFYFKENDWEEYKSTVMRRKGPNGTLLSGATPSTNLGGGSVYKDFDDGTTVITESTALSGITAGASDIAAREKREKKRRHKEREREARRAEKSRSRRHKDENGVLVDEYAEREAKDHLRSYRHEKPARVGGLNKESEASEWDGSTNPADSSVSSNLLSHREVTPTSSPAAKSGGIRKVYSTADRNDARENERIRAEARRLAERGRAAASAASHSDGYSQYHRSSRRDFSYQMAGSTIDESDVGLQRGSRIMEEVSEVGTSELGTKSYQDSRYIPNTGGAPASEYAEEKRRNRRQGGYRRNRD